MDVIRLVTLALLGAVGCSPTGDDDLPALWQEDVEPAAPALGGPSQLAPLPRCTGYRSRAFTIVAIDDETDEIIRFDPDGTSPPTVLARPRGDVDEPERIDTPYDLAVAQSGDLFVANFGTGSVNRFDADGRFVDVVYFDRSVLEEPTSLRIAAGALWVVGNDSRNLVAVDPDGSGLLDAIAGDSSIPWPLALSIDRSASRAFVTATAAVEGERVQVWDLDTGERVDAFGGSELDHVLGVEVGCRGAVYVSTTDTVVRYRPRAVVDGAPMGPFEIEREFDVPGVRRLRAGPDGHVYAGTEDGLVRLNDHATAFAPIPNRVGISMRSFAFAPR